MRQEKIAPIINVKRAMQCVNYLMKRPKTEMVGLGLIYGVPGVGKTRFARRFAIENDFIYLRLDSTTTARSFATQLFNELKLKYSVSDTAKGSANKIFEKCVEIINSIHDDVIIFVDEIDYAFKDHKLLGAVRDIVDETLAIIILVGMQESYRMLLKANTHYFDRCNYFVEFEKLSKKDVQLVCNTIAEISIDNDVVDVIYSKSKGTLRKVIQAIYAIETVAKVKKLDSVKLVDVREVMDDITDKTGKR